MNLKTLIKEPVYLEVLDIFNKAATQRGYIPVEPTPIVSTFWNTTFTPSSSEVFFRYFGDNNLKKSIHTFQPCIRMPDVLLSSDGWHLPLFHMLSFFKFDVDSIIIEIQELLLIIASIIGCDLSKLFFSVPIQSYIKDNNDYINLGSDLLLDIGIPEKNIIYCQGSANYQNGLVVTSENIKASTKGPRIEIYVKQPDGNLREIATCLSVFACLEPGIKHKIFGFAIGIERLSGARANQFNLNYLPFRKNLITTLSQNLLTPSLAETNLGYDAMAQILSILDAIAIARPAVLTYTEHQYPKRRSANRGIKHCYRKLIKSLKHLIDDYGIAVDELLKILAINFEIDISNSIYVDIINEI